MRRWTCAFGLLVLVVGCSTFDAEALRRRAEAGEADAQFELAARHDLGLEVPQDIDEARRWYLRAAEQGHAGAQDSLGSMYLNGDGVEKDYAQAREWYEQAAAQGHGEATNSLAYMYDLGLGVEEDNVRAAQLYERAAELWSARAMMNLGVLLTQGQPGVEVDLVEAYKWLDLARFNTQFSRDMKVKWGCRAKLDELRPKLTEGQVQTALSRGNAWMSEQRAKAKPAMQN